MKDRHHRWLCPFCESPTKVTFKSDDDSIYETCIHILTHLTTCREYILNPNKELHERNLESFLKMNQHEENLVGKIKLHMKDKTPLFNQYLPDGEWLCPYCLIIIPQISLSTSLLREHTAPLQIAKHLIYNCPNFKESKETKPLALVKEKLEQYKIEKVPAKPLTTNDNTYFSQIRHEILQLKNDINQNNELRESIKRARSVVRQMLPQKMPHIQGYEAFVYYKSCADVGGDFFDFVDLKNKHIGIALGDVAGHGLEAALVMGMTRKTLNINSRIFEDSKKTLCKTNDDIVPDLERHTFVTCFYGILNYANHTLDFSRAGHSFSILYHKKTAKAELLRSKGIPLGIHSGIFFENTLENKTIQIEAEDIFVQYSDGLTELADENQQMYGDERLMNIVERFANYDPEYLVHQIKNDLEAFKKNAPQRDDITLLVVKRSRA